MHPSTLLATVCLWLVAVIVCPSQGLPAPSQWHWNLEEADSPTFAREQKSGSSPIAAPVWFLKTNGEKRGRPMSAPLWFLQTELRKKSEEEWPGKPVGAAVPDEWRVQRDVAEQQIQH